MLCLRVCSHFRRDVETALAGLGEEGVRVQAYPAVCSLRPDDAASRMHAGPRRPRVVTAPW
jgi:hypothetical protein